MTKPYMTREDITQSLVALFQDQGPDDAFTMDELRDMLGLGVCAVRRRLKILDNQGRIGVVKVARKNIVGVIVRKPAYQVLPAEVTDG